MSGFASIFGTNGDDTLLGLIPGSKDLISGLPGDDVLIGFGGRDTLIGGLGNDVIFAGGGNDRAFGGDGNDVILGARGDDTLFGGAGNDSLFGGVGNDSLAAGSGDDFLRGGLGDDTMRSGSGHDTFDFSHNFGHDLIIGFQIGNDTLQIPSNINGTGVASPADLGAFITDDGSGNALITLGSDTITLQGISPANAISQIGSIVTIV